MSDNFRSASATVTTTGTTLRRTMELFEKEKERILFSSNFSLDESARVQRFVLDFDRALRRAGQCRHADQVITLSKHFVARAPESAVLETIRHELAHAAAGAGHGHDAYWKDVARRAGSNAERCYSDEGLAAPVVASKYVATCAEGCEIDIHRLGKNLRTGRMQCRKHRKTLTIFTRR